MAPTSADGVEQIVKAFSRWDVKGGGTVSLSLVRDLLVALGQPADRVSLLLGHYATGKADTVPYRAFVQWLHAGQPTEVPRKKYYARPKQEMLFIDRPVETDAQEPAYASLLDFREKNAGDPTVLKQLENRVRMCPQCRKANGFTMPTCNGCAKSLEGVPESHRDNVFMGFIYGVAANKTFPLTISICRETPDFLAFDDILGVSAVHTCVIPTSVYVPDFRWLFTDPVRGLKIIDDMMELGRQTALDLAWSSTDFRNKYFNGEDPPKTTEDMQEVVVLGFNFPPSVCQLHLQFMHGPFFPFHEYQALLGIHQHPGRFFPFEYVRAALACGERARLEVHADTPIEKVIQHVTDLGIDYNAAHKAMMDKTERIVQRFDAWRPEDFDFTVCDGRVFSNETGELVEDADPIKLQNEDHFSMRQYGKPKCSMYKYPKKPGEVKHFGDGP